jgi:hypothetical protein
MHIGWVHREIKVKSPTSRKEREKWGTLHSKARKKKNSFDDLSNSGPVVRLYREGRATGPAATPLQEEDLDHSKDENNAQEN